MKLQIRTLSVQERKELYTQALEVFKKPLYDRPALDMGYGYPEGVCEYLSGLFYGRAVFKDKDYREIKRAARRQGIPRIVELGKELMPELWHRKTEEVMENESFWFKNNEERLVALEDCLYDTVFLMEEDDEQSTKVLYEFEVDWEPQA